MFSKGIIVFLDFWGCPFGGSLRKTGFTLLQVIIVLGIAMVISVGLGSQLASIFKFNKSAENAEEVELLKDFVRNKYDCIRTKAGPPPVCRTSEAPSGMRIRDKNGNIIIGHEPNDPKSRGNYDLRARCITQDSRLLIKVEAKLKSKTSPDSWFDLFSKVPLPQCD